MIVIYKTVPNATIKKDAKASIPKIEAFFEANPKRRICRAQFWYGKFKKIRRNHVKEDVDAVVKECLK